MGKHLHVLILALFLASGIPVSAQVALTLRYEPIEGLYTVWVRAEANWLPPSENILESGRVTLVAPAGNLHPDSLQNLLGTWQLGNIINQPAENPGADYLIFDLIHPAMDSAFYEGQEIPLFSFHNQFGCAGRVELMDPATDPFSPPNSLGIPAGQSLVVAGAGGEAFTGLYDTGQAVCGCRLSFQLNTDAGGYYEVTLRYDDPLATAVQLEGLSVALKVPGHFFKLFNLQNLVSSQMNFAGISRNDAPAEEPGFDYIQINLKAANGQVLQVAPGASIPILRFTNRGKCQGDSIFLVQQSDPFLPPNSQGADIGQKALLSGTMTTEWVCAEGDGAAPCLGCQFLDQVIQVTGLSGDDPVACLGGANGSIQIFAEGAEDLAYSLDAGLTWSSQNLFGGLSAGAYLPLVRGNFAGCPVIQETPDSIRLINSTAFSLRLGLPEKICEGDDLVLSVMSPLPLPPGTIYHWSGPQGFTSGIPDPVLTGTSVYQSGVYSLTVEAPGCDPASHSAETVISPAPEKPSLITPPQVCSGDSLVLSTGAPGSLYQWIGPYGQTPSALSVPGLTTTQQGTSLPYGHPAYLPGIWRVKVFDENGCSAESDAAEVIIQSRPQAFAMNSGPVCPGKEARLFSNVLPGATYRWRKNGEQAIFSVQPEPWIPQVNAQMTFQLEIELDGCLSENIASTTVTLHDKPSAFPVFDYEMAPDCSPKDIQLTANAVGNALTFNWTGVNGFSSQVENPVISNAGSQYNGSYQLTVTDLFGCTAQSPFEISGVVSLPPPVLQSTGAVCPGGNIMLSAQSYTQGQVSYRWFRNGVLLSGATSNQLPLNGVQPLDEGNYRIEVTVDNCKLVSENLWVDVLESPVASPSFVLTYPCEGSSLQFFSNINGISSWNWTGPGGFSSQASNPLIYNTEFNDIGAYSLTVTGINGCIATESVVVDGILPIPEDPHVTSNSPVCPEGEITLVVQNAVNQGDVYYEWINGNGTHLGDGDANLVLAASDPLAVPPFLVKAIVNGCESEWSDPVAVTLIPQPLAIAGYNGTVCPGEEIQLFAAPVPDGIYTWRKAGSAQVLSFEKDPLVVVTDTTVFELTVRTTGCFTEDVDTVTVVPALRPVIGEISGGGTYCEGSQAILRGYNEADLPGIIQFQWTGPSGFNYSGNMLPTDTCQALIGLIQPGNAGTYTLVMTSAGGCVSAPESLAIDVVSKADPPVLAATAPTVCEGENLQLDATPLGGAQVTYDWYFQEGNLDQLLGSTQSPSFVIQEVEASQAGFYYVVGQVNGCPTPPSNLKEVMVWSVGTNVEAYNSTSASGKVCEGEQVELGATFIPGAAYTWFGPGGFQSSLVSPVIPAATMAQGGSYVVQINPAACLEPLIAYTTVYVQPVPETPMLGGSLEACVGTDVEWVIQNPVAGATYELYFSPDHTLIGTGPDPVFLLSEIKGSQSGDYYARAMLDGCISAFSLPGSLEVVQREIVKAYAGQDQLICDPDAIIWLEGNMPVEGVGKWLAGTGAWPVQPNERITRVTGLVPGANRFFWEISQPVCGVYSIDTVEVFLEQIEAETDYWQVSRQDSLNLLDLVANDQVEHILDWDISLIGKPSKGVVWIDGQALASYGVYPDVFGEDAFQYQLCSMSCPDICDTAWVRVEILPATAGSGCFVPNLITPDGDGSNDEFIIPCMAGYPGSSLIVFNRYGSRVFVSEDYRNDWSGTYSGQPLPSGTYFYQATLNDENKTVLKGYIVIVR